MTGKNIDDLLHRLLAREEGTTLDFKKVAYSLKGEHDKGAFLKDVLAMANTPRDEASFIVLGVKKTQGNPPTIDGIEEHRDESEYQELILRYIHPTPTVRYVPASIGDKSIGLLEFPPERTGPYRLSQDLGSTRRHVIYRRVGSRNSEVADDDDERRIREWHSQPSPSAGAQPPSDWEDFQHWAGILEHDRLLILFASPLSQDTLPHVSGLWRNNCRQTRPLGSRQRTPCSSTGRTSDDLSTRKGTPWKPSPTLTEALNSRPTIHSCTTSKAWRCAPRPST